MKTRTITTSKISEVEKEIVRLKKETNGKFMLVVYFNAKEARKNEE